MPRINLLPFKAEQRIATARTELMVFVAIIGVTLLGLYAWYTVVDSDLSEKTRKLDEVNKSLGKLEKAVVKVKDLEKKTKTVEKKKKIIENLEAQRTGPVKLLDDLVTILTSLEGKVWLGSFIEKDGVITLTGEAMEHENVSDFQIALERRSTYFTNVKLSEVRGSNKSGVTVVSWKITCASNYSGGAG